MFISIFKLRNNTSAFPICHAKWCEREKGLPVRFFDGFTQSKQPCKEGIWKMKWMENIQLDFSILNKILYFFQTYFHAYTKGFNHKTLIFAWGDWPPMKANTMQFWCKGIVQMQHSSRWYGGGKHRAYRYVGCAICMCGINRKLVVQMQN